MNIQSQTSHQPRPVVNHNSLLTPEEAARYLQLQPQTLARWRSTKKYPLVHIKIGKNIRYRLSDLDLFIETNVITNG